MLRQSVLFVPLLALLLACQRADSTPPPIWIATAPADTAYTAIDRQGTTVLPNGRLLTPRGTAIPVAPHPYGLVLTADGRTAVTANSGALPISISIIRDATGPQPRVRQVPEGARGDKGVLAAVFMGLAISPDGDTLYVGGGQEAAVVLFDLASGERIGEIDADVAFGGRDYEDSYVGDLVLSRDGKTLYAVDQTNFRVVVADTGTRQIVASVGVGRYPFGLTLTPDGRRLYVANVGMFEYSRLKIVDRAAGPPYFGPSFPVAAFGSKESRDGVEVEGYRSPGLGDPNVPESFSVWGIDVSAPAAAHVVSKVKTGILVGEKVEEFPAIGGSSPNSLVSTDELVFVSNGNNDTVSVIDTTSHTVVADIVLTLDERLGNVAPEAHRSTLEPEAHRSTLEPEAHRSTLEPEAHRSTLEPVARRSTLRGQIPFGLALSPDAKRLYVAEAGINAVAVVDLPSYEVLGHLPVGWFPSKLAVTPDGRKLVVANAKGWGSGPNGGSDFSVGEVGSFIGNLMYGFVSVVDVPADEDLPAETARVVANNFRLRTADDKAFADRRENPIPLYSGEKPSPIEHLVFITKQNRTYDEIFGQLAGARGDPSLARFGENVTVSNLDGTVTLADVDVMPNHLALARRFAISDNFYCDSDVTADGHRWLVGVYPNEWVETYVAAAYGGGRNVITRPTTAPGALALGGASISPEDYNEAGSIWDHFDRFGIDFFNFGLGFSFAGGARLQDFKYTGARFTVNYPMPAPLYQRTSRKFATYSMAIPDQFRVEMFIEELEERFLGEGKTFPQVLTVMLANDHGWHERPDDGYPFNESYMADNDLALGRVVEFLSHTPYWDKMAIVVTEDDAQGGVDSIDAHRSVLMVISPWAKRGYVSNVHTSFGSLMKTFWHILGVPYLNQYDAGATDLADFFTAEPDTAPYNAIALDPRLFDPAKALDPLDEEFDWEALDDSPVMDDIEVMQAWAAEEDARRQERRDASKRFDS